MGTSEQLNALTTIESHHEFESHPSSFERRMSHAKQEKKTIATNLSVLYAGLAIKTEAEQKLAVGIAIHDGTYSIDFSVHHLCLPPSSSEQHQADTVEEFAVSKLEEFRHGHLCKILGAGLSVELHNHSPRLASRLWQDLDIVPMVFRVGMDLSPETARSVQNGHEWSIDEQADSVAKKCIMFFGPTQQPRLQLGYKNDVQVDAAGRIKLAMLEDYRNSVRDPTWRAVMKYVENIKGRKLKIVFFSATPQGGGVALMRHALLRFLHLLGVDVQWFVPTPRQEVFRITKTNHNILQGVADPSVRATDEQLDKIKNWIKDNAKRYWLAEAGPLLPPSKGGADVIIVDDPQMPEIIPLAKEADPKRPVIFRSHIEVRDDLVQQDGSAAQHVWQSMWKNIKLADVFISHPVHTFVPSDVKKETLGWMPATTDWLDGLNKDMRDWDNDFYLHYFGQECRNHSMPELAYPSRGYIAQIARFDPAKGIPDVIRGFAKFRRDLLKGVSINETPQLVICGHSSVDDPDGTLIYDQTMDLIHHEFDDLKDDIVVVRLGPSDQLLNAVISKASIVLQLSTREGFEVKVSEALHKGKPVITTNTGGIPLQVVNGKNGFLVGRSDTDAVAKHLHELWTDADLYDRMSNFARDNVSDEVHTVGNALNWLFLASSLAGGRELRPDGRWINDLAREGAGEEYAEGEPRLPRGLST
ncbi:Glycosyl transferase, family 1 [Lasallia pustulata]|uniref:Glycosyl transferase, family 1 n=1 Tax=Lasallia pustulata TaxID=136370 RepID=A0A1W5DD57_9LECA|nr:Glycosyl transferase, family 1 [Lasallia pustulata]